MCDKLTVHILRVNVVHSLFKGKESTARDECLGGGKIQKTYATHLIDWQMPSDFGIKLRFASEVYLTHRGSAVKRWLKKINMSALINLYCQSHSPLPLVSSSSYLLFLFLFFFLLFLIKKISSIFQVFFVRISHQTKKNLFLLLSRCVDLTFPFHHLDFYVHRSHNIWAWVFMKNSNDDSIKNVWTWVIFGYIAFNDFFCVSEFTHRLLFSNFCDFY